MKKYTIISLSSLFLIGMSVFSCSKSLDNSEETLPQKKVNANIPANFASSKVVADGGAATFSTSEKVFVYNNTTSSLDTEYLSPDADGATSNLKGSLAGSYSKGDNLNLLYNTTSEGIVDYMNQDGTLENVVDAATATVKISSVDGDSFTTRTAYFENLQSIFKFTFKDPDNNIVKVKSLTILSENNKLQSEYNLLDEAVTYGGINVICNTAQSTVYVALRFTSNPSEMIVFSVIDENGKVYTGSKTSPATGFKIGRFYTSTISVKAHKHLLEYVEPSVSYGAKSKEGYVSTGNLCLKGGVYTFRTPVLNPSSYGFATDYFTYETGKLFTKGNTENENIEVNGVKGWYIAYPRGTNPKYPGSTSVTTHINITTNSSYNNMPGVLLPPTDITEEDVDGLKYGSASTIQNQNINICYYLAKGFIFLPYAGYIKDDNLRYGLSTGSFVLWAVPDNYNGKDNVYVKCISKSEFRLGSSDKHSDFVSYAYRYYIRLCHD